MQEYKTKSTLHWLVLISLCGLIASSIGLPIMANGVFIQPVSESLGVLRGSIAMHNTVTMIVSAFVAIYTPRLMNTMSFKRLILIGSLLAGLSTLGFAFSRSVLLFNFLGFTRGVGTGLISPVLANLVLTEWFDEKHGLAL